MQRLRCQPRPEMAASIWSPSARNRRQWAPLPAGDPVRMRSPGCSAVMCEAYETSRDTSKIMSLVDSSCITRPFRLSVIRRSIGWSTNTLGTSTGPVGRNVGAFLLRSQSVPIFPRSGR